jgi:hypothetical protein
MKSKTEELILTSAIRVCEWANSRRWLLLNALGITVFVFGLLLWGYSVTIQLTHPIWLADTLSHHFFPPLNWRVDDVGLIGFAIAPFGFFTWIITRSRLPGSRHEKPRMEPPNFASHAIGTTADPVTSPVTSANGGLRRTKARRPRRSKSSLPHRRTPRRPST